MPKYKDSSEVRAAKKERKEKLKKFLQLLDVENYNNLHLVFGEILKKTNLRQCLKTSSNTAESPSKQVPVRLK